MLNAFSKLFAAKIPTINVAGVALTQEETAQLLQTCSTLKRTLDSQLDAIHGLLTVQYPQIKSKIRRIQLKHVDTQTYLSHVVLKTQNSTRSWAREFADAQKALEQKIVSINRCSRKTGVIATALQSWPVVAETYVWLLPMVVRLQSELRTVLEGKEPRVADTSLQAGDEPELTADQKKQEPAALYTDCPRVPFGTDVTVREYRIGESISERARETYCVTLTDDRKRSVGSFKSEKAKFV